MSKKPIFVVTENDSGQRLDNYLLKHRKQVASSNWYKLIRKGQVRINGKRCQPKSKLLAGDEVRIPPAIFFTEQAPLKVSEQEQQRVLSCVVDDHADYLLINKPAGMPVHAGTGHRVGLMEIITSIPGKEQCQLAHRLDKDTSGCLLLAKNRQALLAFQQAMQAQQVEKTYSALLAGELREPVTVDQPLNTGHRVNGIRTVVVDPAGQSAVTHFTPLASSPQVSRVRCQIETGRTHQIRVHARWLGCPVLGDRLYGRALPDASRELFLHAGSLSFAGYRFEVPEPAEFDRMYQHMSTD
jgi:23S rRNA pseudouridine955/2504/2580 synthase